MCVSGLVMDVRVRVSSVFFSGFVGTLGFGQVGRLNGCTRRLGAVRTGVCSSPTAART